MKRIIELYNRYSSILVLVLVTLVAYLLTINMDANKHLRDVSRASKKEREVFSVWKDSMAREHGKIKVVAEYTNQLQPEIKAKLDETAAILKVATGDIGSLTEVSTSTTGVISTRIDSQGQLLFADKYLTLKATAKDSILTGTYTYTDKLHHTIYTRKKKILGITYNTEKYVDFYFDNPNTKITNLEHFELKEFMRPKRWGVGPSVGITYYDGKIRPYVGIGLSYNLVRF